ncbi:MAG: hypothetical protein ACRD18_08990 [Terriglobia bacterium]
MATHACGDEHFVDYLPAMSLLYIFAATKTEARALRRMPPVRWVRSAEGERKTGIIGPNRVEAFITGMGPAAARAAAQAVIRAVHTSELPRPDAVCVIGACGSLSAGLPENTIVIYNSCLQEEGTPPPGENRSGINSSPTLVSRLAAALMANGIPCKAVTGITSPKVAARRHDKLRLAGWGAHVVDMESYQVLALAHEASIPCVALRAVSDSLDRTLPDFSLAIKASGELDTRRAARIALYAPISTARLIVAQRRALQRLSQAMEVVLASACWSKGA